MAAPCDAAADQVWRRTVVAYYDFNGVKYHDGTQATIGDLYFNYVLQSLNPRFTVFQTVSEPLIVHNVGETYAEREEMVAKALESAERLARRIFSGTRARGLFAGIAAHAMLPLDKLPTGAVGLVLAVTAHTAGWVFPRGGSQRLADALAKLHGPVLLINGHERDFMMAASAANFDAINHVPVFYGARRGAGHTATVDHPGGGEFANVASNWLRWQFKNDKAAAKMFVGKDCALCKNSNWDTRSKKMN